MLPEPDAMCDKAPVSRNQSPPEPDCWRDKFVRAARSWGSSGDVAAVGAALVATCAFGVGGRGPRMPTPERY